MDRAKFFFCLKMLRNAVTNTFKLLAGRSIATSAVRFKVEDKKMMLRSLPARDEGTQGALTVDIDTIIAK